MPAPNKEGAALNIAVHAKINQSHEPIHANDNVMANVDTPGNDEDAAMIDASSDHEQDEEAHSTEDDAPNENDNDHDDDTTKDDVDCIMQDSEDKAVSPQNVCQSTTETTPNPIESDESKCRNDSEDKPVVDDDTFDSENEQKSNDTPSVRIELDPQHGHCSKQGYRSSMEDEVVIKANYTVIGSKCTSGYMSLYGVFDGHGGDKCASFCAQHLISILTKYFMICDDVESVFTETIAELDNKAIDYSDDASGSTCCIVLIDRRTHDLWCCNVGDSRCILMNDSYDEVKQLSIEHKPDFPMEKQRIENANGWVTYGRVCGILAVSRSLGDKDFKYEIKDLIVSTPDITHHKVALDKDKSVVLACDGLYDVFSNQQCMEWMREMNTTSMTTQKLTEKLCNDAIYVRKSKDNVSILIIQLDHCEVAIEPQEEEAAQQEDSDVIDDAVTPNSVDAQDDESRIKEQDGVEAAKENDDDAMHERLLIDDGSSITQPSDIADFEGQEMSMENDDDSEHKLAEEYDVKKLKDGHDISSTNISMVEDVEESLNDSLSSGQSQDHDAVTSKKHTFHVERLEDDDDDDRNEDMEDMEMEIEHQGSD